MQNGVANERTAKRHFDRVYGATLSAPTAYLEPGVVASFGKDFSGIIDLGRVSGGTDTVSADVAAAHELAIPGDAVS